MKIVIIGIVSVFLAGLATAQDKPKPKMLRITVDDIANDFKANEAAARKRFAPPKDGVGGVIVQLESQRLQSVRKNELNLYAESSVKVVVIAKDFKETVKGSNLVTCSCTFRDFKNNTVYFDSSDVKINRVIP